MSWPEYLEWQALDTMEPIGFLRDDYLAAHVAMASVRPHVKGEIDPADFQPFSAKRFDGPEDDDDGEEMTVSGWLSAARRVGLKVQREGEEG